MTTKSKEAAKTQGAEAAKGKVRNIQEIESALEKKMNFFEQFNVKVKNHRLYQTHIQKLKSYKEEINENDIPSHVSPKIVLQFGRHNEYEISSLDWLNLISDFMIEKITEKATALESEIVKLSIE